ncbi:MAG: histidinol-phosphate transaminase, partial [Coriobacteriia bacterium]|nr:histidinol-phosphate transaminase [Coriobacteriia bacterium]
ARRPCSARAPHPPRPPEGANNHMKPVRPSAPQLQDLVPYDPKYIPCNIMNSANENPLDVDESIKHEIMREIRGVAFNRYPDPLANDLRDMIAQANGLDRNQVLVGNGGDELLFCTALAYGGPGRKFLNLPPTFSVYVNNAQLTNTEVVNVPRNADFSINEEAVLERVSQGDIDFVIVTSPNNPTGQLAPEDFVLRLLEATDALVMVDEAYFEFSRTSLRPYLLQYENLVLLRTFSKAFSLAGVRLGYLLGNESVIREYMKVRQPYSVDAVSQAVGRVVFKNRARFEPGINAIITERARLLEEMPKIPGVKPYPSDSNYILFSVPNAADVWQALFDRGILIRDFSRAPLLEGTLRVSVGTPEENTAFLRALRDIVIG